MKINLNSNANSNLNHLISDWRTNEIHLAISLCIGVKVRAHAYHIHCCWKVYDAYLQHCLQNCKWIYVLVLCYFNGKSMACVNLNFMFHPNVGNAQLLWEFSMVLFISFISHCLYLHISACTKCFVRFFLRLQHIFVDRIIIIHIT